MAYDIHPGRPVASPPQAERSLGDLFGDLTRDTATLVRQEVALAKAELSQKAASAGKDVGMVAAGGALAYGGLLVLLGSVVFMLVAAGLSAWLAALLVGLVAAGGGAAVAMAGLNKLRNIDPVPRQTMQTLKEDVQAIKETAQR